MGEKFIVIGLEGKHPRIISGTSMSVEKRKHYYRQEVFDIKEKAYNRIMNYLSNELEGAQQRVESIKLKIKLCQDEYKDELPLTEKEE